MQDHSQPAPQGLTVVEFVCFKFIKPLFVNYASAATNKNDKYVKLKMSPQYFVGLNCINDVFAIRYLLASCSFKACGIFLVLK